jgi:hypothetical protein
MRDARLIYDPARALRQKRKIALAAGLAFIAAQAVILWGTLTKSGGEVGERILPGDKAEHFVAFAGLMLLALPAFPGLSPAALALALGIEGGLIEIIQAMPVVGRDGDVSDWAADLAGILTVVAALIAGHMRHRLRREV